MTVDELNKLSIKIDNAFNAAIIDLGYDPNNPNDRKSISQNELTAALHNVYVELFKPSTNMINNQAANFDYNDIDFIKLLADKFLYICFWFNKSMGLLQFSVFTGIHTATLYKWKTENGEKLNPKRCEIIKNICEAHKGLQIGLLNMSPVGIMAVANNDSETGLEWSKNQAQQITNNTVYLLPSERVDRLKLTDGSV